jgi:hypothetical protein
MRSLLRIVVLLALVSGIQFGSAAAAPLPQCIGACTVHCDSGATLHYSVPSWQCCSKIANCPDASGYAEWFPGYGPACFGDYARFCA